MSERLDSNFERLNKVLDTITESLVDVSRQRDEQNASISNLSRMIDAKTNNVTEKCIKLESKIRRTENNMVEDINKVCSQNKIIHSGLDKRIISLEDQIKLMEEAIAALKTKHEENITLINELRPKVGKKRKWWQVI
jgi:chromosome segregation ATPase